MTVTQGAKIEPGCSLECKLLTSDDYRDLLWTTLAEFPGEILPINCVGCKSPVKLQYDFCMSTFNICPRLLAVEEEYDDVLLRIILVDGVCFSGRPGGGSGYGGLSGQEKKHGLASLHLYSEPSALVRLYWEVMPMCVRVICM